MMMCRPPCQGGKNLCRDIDTRLSVNDDLCGLCLHIWELFIGYCVYVDLDGVEVEEH
jgi:hypothetical protein